jgi:hypothetical protein
MERTNMRKLTPIDRHNIEAVIDACGLGSVLTAIGEICGEKAEHVRTNWQDEPLAKQWDAHGTRVTKLADKVVDFYLGARPASQRKGK